MNRQRLLLSGSLLKVNVTKTMAILPDAWLVKMCNFFISVKGGGGG